MALRVMKKLKKMFKVMMTYLLTMLSIMLLHENGDKDEAGVIMVSKRLLSIIHDQMATIVGMRVSWSWVMSMNQLTHLKVFMLVWANHK